MCLKDCELLIMQSDRLPTTRKANSATKVRDIERLLSHSFKEHERISSASASNYTTRTIRNFHELKNIKFSGSINKHTNTDNKTKLFLYATQVLGKLKKFGGKCYADLQYPFSSEINEVGTDSHNLKLNTRNVNYYYDLLKRLLEHRCVLLLNEESQFCVKQIQVLATDLKFLYTNEMLKLATMPVKTYNRFIDSSGVSISVLQELFRKVNYVCDLYLSLKNNYQKIINFFHVGFDMELYQRFLKVNKFLNELFSEMFYWTHKILDVFILKLCLADTDSISPEFLHHVVEMYDSFNLLFINTKQIKYTCLGSVHNVFLNSYIQFDYEAVLLDFILQYLSHFEAKVVAEKIIHFLSYECKNRIHSVFQEESAEKWQRDKETSNSNTSDYCSASPTVIDTEITHVSESSNFSNIYLSFIQRNQTLVLKYLYSITSLSRTVATKNKKNSSESHGELTTGGNAWNLSKIGCRNKNYLCLEERYWMRFWQNVLKFSLKLILEVPCHQYGNASAGVFLFWPRSYHYVFLNYLHSCVEIAEISVAGLDVMQKMYHTLHIQTIYESWDKRMSSALSLIHGQPCMPIPVTPNKIRTRIGNVLYSCLEALRLKVPKDHVSLESLYLQMFYHYQITLDCIILFYTVKARTSISSCDISSFLFLCRSDCVHIFKFLEENEYFDVFLNCRHLRLFSSCNKENFILKQIEIVAGYVSDAPYVLYQTVSRTVKDNVSLLLKKRFTRNVYHNNLNTRTISFNEILDSFANTIGHTCDGSGVLYAIASAYAHETLHVMQLMQRNLSKKKVHILKETMLEFLKWIDQQNIDLSELEKLHDMICLKKLQFIIEIIESSLSNSRKCRKVSNKVSPVVSDKTDERCTLLTEEERLQWQLCIRHNLFCF